MSTSTAPAPRPTLASFWHDLPREGRLLLTVVVLEFLGTGLVLPFHVVYLHEVRGFALGDVGLLLGLPPLVGFLVVGPGGSAIDRLGARRILLASLGLLIAGHVVLAFATTLAVAGFALVLYGLTTLQHGMGGLAESLHPSDLPAVLGMPGVGWIAGSVGLATLIVTGLAR
jgi:MFS family permease